MDGEKGREGERERDKERERNENKDTFVRAKRNGLQREVCEAWTHNASSGRSTGGPDYEEWWLGGWRR